MIRTVLATLVSHWRRHPGHLIALLIGLASATALRSGVQALNAQARDSYDRAAGLLGADALDRIEAADGTLIATETYAKLRRGGWRVSPVLQGRARLGDVAVSVVGIDILTLPPGTTGVSQLGTQDLSTAFLGPPWLILTHPQTAAELDMPGTDLRTDPDIPPGTVIADIALAQSLTGQPSGISHLMVAPRQLPDRIPLPAGLRQTAPEGRADIARLTDSFHLNLTAFGLLSFLVGLFIAHATIGLAFEQRRAMIRTLRATGASGRAVMTALGIELALIAALAWAIGMSLGYVIAAALLPDVSASLRGLYGAPVGAELHLTARWWLSGLGMTLAGAGLAAASGLWRVHRMPVLASATPLAWVESQRRAHRLQCVLGAGLWALAVVLALTATSLLGGFAMVAALLVGAALLLPPALAACLDALVRLARGPVSEWFLAEARAQLSGLSLALMALLLALAINIGVGTMVASFRQTFIAYLDQRLGADLYLRARTVDQAQKIAAYLATRSDVTDILPVWHAEIEVRGYPVSLYGVADAPSYRADWPLLTPREGTWDAVAGGTGIVISEQMARYLGLAPGASVTLPTPDGGWPLTIAGIYPDYGNPTGQALVAIDPFLARWPDVERTRYAIHTAPGAAAGIKALIDTRFALGPEDLVDQAGLKAYSRAIFERTFTVTLALNTLTFVVAGLALMTSLLTLAQMRLPQVAPLWAMGLTRRRIAGLELMRVAALALLTAVLAIPLGLVIGWALLDWINVAAFGWRIPLQLFPGQWAALVALALAAATLAAVWPSRHLLRMAPAALLRVFADAR